MNSWQRLFCGPIVCLFPSVIVAFAVQTPLNLMQSCLSAPPFSFLGFGVPVQKIFPELGVLPHISLW